MNHTGIRSIHWPIMNGIRDRTEKYVVMYDNGKSDNKTLDDWLSIQVGDKYKRVYCLLFTYKTKELR